MEPKFFRLPVSVGEVTLRVAKGHFATRNSHTNYFIDVTAQKWNLREANAVARALAEQLSNRMVDTIFCMDSSSVIGTCLAQQLTQTGYRTLNENQDIYVFKGELNHNGKILVRDNARYMMDNKNILVLVCSITSGVTPLQGIKTARYYGANVIGVAAIYSSMREIEGVPVTSLFDYHSLEGYAGYAPSECPMCKKGQPVDAVINKFGYSRV